MYRKQRWATDSQATTTAIKVRKRPGCVCLTKALQQTIYLSCNVGIVPERHQLINYLKFAGSGYHRTKSRNGRSRSRTRSRSPHRTDSHPHSSRSSSASSVSSSSSLSPSSASSRAPSPGRVHSSQPSSPNSQNHSTKLGHNRSDSRDRSATKGWHRFLLVYVDIQKNAKISFRANILGCVSF